MAEPTRTVERLRLRAGSEYAVRRAAALLDDAFRTASLPDAARVLVVRRLRLGRLGLTMSPQVLSRIVESRFATGGWTVAHGADAHADRADAVWFRDCLEACQLAATRSAAGLPVDAWFWRLAVPALGAATRPHDVLRAIAFSLASRPEAPAAVPAWTAALAREGHAVSLIAALRPGDGRALLRVAGLGGAARSQSISRGPDAPWPPRGGDQRGDVAAGAAEMNAQPGRTQWDDRFAFVAQMLEIAGTPWPNGQSPARERRPPGESPVPRETAAAIADAPSRRVPLPAGLSPRPLRSKNTPPARSSDMAAPGETAEAASPAPNDARASARRETGRHTRSRLATSRPGGLESGIETDPPAATSRTTHPDTRATGWMVPEGEPTAAGGLLLLVPALSRLGFADWCDAGDLDWRSTRTLASDILGTLLERLGIDPIDPAWMLTNAFVQAHDTLAPEPCLRQGAPHDLQPFLESRLARLRVPWCGGDAAISCDRGVGDAAGLWLSACRRLLRIRAGIGPARLVRRTARIAITPTHVDVFFRQADADVRVRRAGLDIDPGWVSWLGRVVTFHYGEPRWT